MPRRDPTVIWNGFLEIVKRSLCSSFSGSLHFTQTLETGDSGSRDQSPALERLIRCARRERRRPCWCWKVAKARGEEGVAARASGEDEEEGAGLVSGSGAAGTSLVLAKHIRHLPPNRGL